MSGILMLPISGQGHYGRADKSSLVQEEGCLSHLYRCRALNPVRAIMVTKPAAYLWSCHQINVLGKDKTERLRRYRALFKQYLKPELLTEIRANSNSGLAIGSDKLKQQSEALTGRAMLQEKRGRSVGWRMSDA